MYICYLTTVRNKQNNLILEHPVQTKIRFNTILGHKQQKHKKPSVSLNKTSIT